MMIGRKNIWDCAELAPYQSGFTARRAFVEGILWSSFVTPTFSSLTANSSIHCTPAVISHCRFSISGLSTATKLDKVLEDAG